MLLPLALLLFSSPAPQRHSAPATVTISTPRGETRLDVVTLDGAPMLLAAPLAGALGGRLAVTDGWVEMVIVTQSYRFLLGAPFLAQGADPVTILPLAAPAQSRADSVLLPLEFVSTVLPRALRERYSWDAAGARLVERGPPVVARPPQPRRLPNGLLPGHLVVIDPGHGGIDPGNPSLYFPRGMKEKDVALSVGLLLRDELKRRGIQVRMTRTTDTLINLADRGPMCSAACDLFLSLHVNSLPRRRDYTKTRGYETYFLSEARTEDAAATARMENEAIRYEVDLDTTRAGSDPLDFVFRDLLVNEHLRESARAAALMQDHLAAAHTGPDRGVRQANFAVLRTSRRPSILVEMGFSTNRDDSRILSGRAGQRAIAKALADAVETYLKEYEQRSGQAELGGPSR
ncbi:MAG TPA: N-acetylmuramoyl-L-alanine amidase [Gemmatimonadales bacterium]|nr:N-acetylmuramoyl-L-alanine amidase [Gemmatimonadales bacterium]